MQEQQAAAEAAAAARRAAARCEIAAILIAPCKLACIVEQAKQPECRQVSTRLAPLPLLSHRLYLHRPTIAISIIKRP